MLTLLVFLVLYITISAAVIYYVIKRDSESRLKLVFQAIVIFIISVVMSLTVIDLLNLPLVDNGMYVWRNVLIDALIFLVMPLIISFISQLSF